MRISYKLNLLFLLAMLSACHSYTNSLKVAPTVGGTPTAQMQQVLDALNRLDPKPISKLDPAAARLQPTATDAVLTVIQDKGDAAPKRLPPVGKVEMSFFMTKDGYKVPLRVYSPPGEGPFPVVVYYHGGGWVIANLDTYDSSARALASLSKSVVVSVDYRRAPEFKFPTAHEDSYEAFQYVAKNSGTFNGIPGKIAVAGESAGGNLANGVSLLSIERRETVPAHQILVYPITNYAFDSESYQVNKNVKPLNAEMMRWFFHHYLASESDGRNVVVSPLTLDAARLNKLPPTTIVNASIDPLQSEGIAYAHRLKNAGVDVMAVNFEGVTHEFFGMAAVLDEALEAETLVAKRLRATFGK